MKKRTTQREAIVRVLMSTREHPSAEWIYEQVKLEIPNIGFATVYRNLRSLREKGLIVELRVGSGVARYDADTSAHYHVGCSQCGQIVDFDEPVDTDVDRRVARKTGYEVTGHVPMVVGLCPSCQKQGAAQPDSGPGLEEVLMREAATPADEQMETGRP